MKKFFVLSLLLTFAVIVMAACGGGATATEEATPAPAGATATPAPTGTDPSDIPSSWLVPERTTINVATSLAPNWGSSKRWRILAMAGIVYQCSCKLDNFP